ncbi:restriction endonuclease subunit S [Nocardia sp. NPDC049190]|uniref:restriction endonuclease subunit S n=1 Tax=Nocardia sp. NPDC049190 TaxID=3155650 RepID=UPI00340CDBFB
MQSVKLGEVSAINPRPPERLDDEQLVSFLGTADIDAGGTTSTGVTCEFKKVSTGYTQFLDGDILVAKITPCFENGKIAQAKIRHHNGSGSTEFHVIRPDPHELNSRYLLHFLRQKYIRIEGERRMTGSAGQRRVPANFLANLSVPQPVIAEQRRIAEVLDKVDALREKRRKSIALLDDLAQSLFLHMFSDSSTQPSERNIIPLADAYWFQEGPGIRKWQFTDSGVKILNVRNIEREGKLNLASTDRHVSTEEAHGRYKHFLVDSGDLVIASSGISFDSDKLLRTRGAFVSQSDLPLLMNTSTIRFKTKSNKATLEYLHAWISSPEFRSQITKLVTGSAQKNFGPSHLSALKIGLPPIESQREFEQRIKKQAEAREVAVAHLRSLDALFDSIQSRAFRGELWQDDVKDL